MILSATQSASSSSPKDLSIEAIRGWASVAVLIWHLVLAFYPDFIFVPGKGILGLPFYGLIHGTAASGVFFLLTGFVLTKRFFETADHQILITGAAKRWFRFLPLALMSVLMSWCLYRFNLYAYRDAGAITHSNWLYNSGGVYPPPVHSGFFAALWEGTIGIFFVGKSTFNSNLWAMFFEMYGSFAAFGFAWIISLCRGQHHIVALCFFLCAAGLYALDQCYVIFLTGTLLAAYTPHMRRLNLPWGMALLALGFYGLGFRAPLGAYAYLQPFVSFIQEVTFVFTTLGGALIIIACTRCKKINQALQNPAARFLGSLSYPLYLLHIILICSVGSAVFTALASLSYNLAAFTAMAAVATVAFLFAYVLAKFDRWWVRHINRAAFLIYQDLGRLLTTFLSGFKKHALQKRQHA